MNYSLFVLIGLSVVTISFGASMILICIASVFVAIASRSVSVAASTVMIGHKKMPGGYSFSEFVTLMTWTALKGGMSLALVMSTKELFAATPDIYNILLDVTYITILFTVIFQGLSVGRGYRLIEKHKTKRIMKKGASL